MPKACPNCHSLLWNKPRIRKWGKALAAKAPRKYGAGRENKSGFGRTARPIFTDDQNKKSAGNGAKLTARIRAVLQDAVGRQRAMETKPGRKK
jgi:hypothetical protein